MNTLKAKLTFITCLYTINQYNDKNLNIRLSEKYR